MAVTLAQSALLSQNMLRRGVIETFIQFSPVLDRIPLMPIEGNAFAYNSEGTLPGIEFRAVNSAYAESTGVVNQSTESLVILGGDADVDRFIVQTRGNLNDQRAVQTRMKVKAASFKFSDAFINGDTAVDANSFDGLKKRLTGAQVIVAGTNGLPMIGNGGTDADAFLDAVDNLIAAVSLGGGPPNALYMNRATLTRFGGLLRRKLIYVETPDNFGRPQLTYAGIPLLDIGTKADGTQIIPQTEVAGTSNVTSSIYAVRFGEDEGDASVTGLTNGGVMVDDLGQLETKPVYRTRIEFYCGVAVFGGKGAARLTGVLAS